MKPNKPAPIPTVKIVTSPLFGVAVIIYDERGMKVFYGVREIKA